MKLFLATLASVTAPVSVVAAARLGKHDDRHGKHDDRHAVPVVLQGPGEQLQNYEVTADDTECPDLQEEDGYDCGMREEMAGTWIGEDKWYSEDYDYVFDYCSQATWDPNNDESNLEWDSIDLGTGGSNTCSDVDVDPLEKTGTLIAEDYELHLNVEQKRCLPASECTFDVLASGDFPTDTTVQAKACHSHLEVNLETEARSCELIQLNLLEDGDGHQDVVAVISYFTFPGGYDNFTCPSSMAYDVDTLLEDGNMVGMSRFVLQDPPENVNTDGWCP